MDNWWFIMVIAVVAIATYFLYDRRRRSAQGEAERQRGSSGTGDFLADRESSRLDRMSAEDRAWEQASLRKNQSQQEQTGSPQPPSPTLAGRDGDPGP